MPMPSSRSWSSPVAKKSPKQTLRQAIAAANRGKHERAIMEAVKLAGVAKPMTEYKFHLDRKWRFDYAWPCVHVAIEVNGGGGRGRHNTVIGATRDAEKLNAAVVMGWRVLTYTVVSIKDVDQIAKDLKALLTGV